MKSARKWVLFVSIGSFASGCAHGGGPARRVNSPASPVAEDPVSRTITGLRSTGAVLIPNTHQVVLRDMAALRILAAEA